jgi:uncharacterized membrane protein YheB (UPF0754 family)
MKTLADCKPSEFLKQTNRIRKAVERWLTDTDILNIRKRLPVLEAVDNTDSNADKEAAKARNAAIMRAQMKKNLSAMLDAMLEDHPEETLEILALCCFVEPENVDDYPIKEYLSSFTQLISDEAVIGFFTSLALLGEMNTSASARA